MGQQQRKFDRAVGPAVYKHAPKGLTGTSANGRKVRHALGEHGMPHVGSLIADTYRVLGPLDEGGMGSVLLAKDERLQREVAIKLVHPSLLATANVRARFLVEARAMARVRHENVVEIFAFGELNQTPYFVMEYVPGVNLAHWLDDIALSGSHPPIDTALSYLDQLCRGVEAIHRSGSVHGDLKPSNILLGAAGRVAIADMGLSRMLDRNERKASEHPMAGTPAYMAPEFARTDLTAELIRRGDVFALGVLAFEMLTGEPPWDIESTADMLRVHASKPTPIASQVRPEITSVFDEPLLAALQADPQRRTASADAFRRALLSAREELTKNYSSVRIVVADDDRDFRALARETLRFGFPGARIDVVRDGDTALRACDAQEPALVLIDLDMPGLNGVELTAALRARYAMPILVVTASGSAPDWRLLQALGASGFLVKPIDPYALITLARRAIDS